MALKNGKTSISGFICGSQRNRTIQIAHRDHIWSVISACISPSFSNSTLKLSDCAMWRPRIEKTTSSIGICGSSTLCFNSQPTHKTSHRQLVSPLKPSSSRFDGHSPRVVVHLHCKRLPITHTTQHCDTDWPRSFNEKLKRYRTSTYCLASVWDTRLSRVPLASKCTGVRFLSSSGTDTTNNAGHIRRIQLEIPISFDSGYFRLKFGSLEGIFHYWTPVDFVLQTLREELSPGKTKSIDQSAKLENSSESAWKSIQVEQLGVEIEPDDSVNPSDSGSESGTNDFTSNTTRTSKSQTFRYRLAPSMPLGFAFVTLDPERIILIGKGQDKSRHDNENVFIEFKLTTKGQSALKTKIESWAQENVNINNLYGKRGDTANSAFSYQTSKSGSNSFAKHELLFLEQEKQSLKLRFEPMQVEFNRLVDLAKAEAHRKFKFGGLFLLSAQLGFVGRLTWFEYSWDIMEPVTWMLTYAMMVGTFAYYIVTSEEYIVPMVEKRMVLTKFWKLVNTTRFDVRQYRILRDELRRLDKQITHLKIAYKMF